jgi:transcriptional regulator with XRE-family HTH domain
MSTNLVQASHKMSYRHMTAAQMRAARGLLDWTQGKLADVSGVALSTIKRMESVGPEKSSVENIDRVSTALEEGGVEFTNGDAPGVKLRKPFLRPEG